MINEFSVTPKPQNNKAKSYLLALLLLGTLILLVSASLEAYRGLIAVFSLVPFTLAILIYTKYILAKYVYDVFTDTDGVPLFTVRQITGKRSVTLCRVELASIIKAETETKKDSQKAKRESSVPLYSYCPTLFPEKRIRLTLVGYNAKSEVLIEGNDDFCALINSYAKEARKIRADGEE